MAGLKREGRLEKRRQAMEAMPKLIEESTNVKIGKFYEI